MRRMECRYPLINSGSDLPLHEKTTTEWNFLFQDHRQHEYVCVCACVRACVCVCVCVYSNSRNDVSRVAQRYGTIAAHTRRRTSVFVYVVFCVHVYSFASLIRRTPPPTFSDTAITDRHSDTTIFQLRAH